VVSGLKSLPSVSSLRSVQGSMLCVKWLNGSKFKVYKVSHVVSCSREFVKSCCLSMCSIYVFYVPMWFRVYKVFKVKSS
jgi:hypothetical protein